MRLRTTIALQKLRVGARNPTYTDEMIDTMRFVTIRGSVAG